MASTTPTLQRVLQDQDPGFHRIVAELWGIDPPAESGDLGRGLAAAMLEPANASEVIGGLRPEARDILLAIRQSGGQLPILDLERRYGAIRPMGPGRRDREKPWRAPTSPLEDLWYRALVGRAFSDAPTGPIEVLFLPSDLIPFIAEVASPSLPGAAIAAPARSRGASFAAIEDLTLLLAALRREPAPSEPAALARLSDLRPFLVQPDAGPLLLRLAVDLGLLAGKRLQPDPEPVRAFLESSPTAALATLLISWRDTRRWNDLGQLGYLEPPRAGWPNQADGARGAFLQNLDRVPRHAWWSTESFVAWMREHAPGYQRPGGDFDAWHLQIHGSTEFADGFEYWEAIDGELLRSYFRGPLCWLGAVRLSDAGPPGFQLTPMAEALFGRPAFDLPVPPSAPARLRPDGVVIVPSTCAAAERYQVARVADWRSRSADGLEFVLTTSSIRGAVAQGLSADQVVALLESASGEGLPPNLVSAIRGVRPVSRRTGTQPAPALDLDNETVRLLKASRATARLLAPAPRDHLYLRPGVSWEAFRAAAARAGLLLETSVAE